MVFSSIYFLLFFLPVFLLVYQLLRNNTLKNLWIFLASLFFYSWGAPLFVFILLGSTIIDFYLVRAMYRHRQEQGRRRLLIISIGINLGLLAYFKYSNFFVDNINHLLQTLGANPLGWVEVMLPIGISFYTFQTLTYSIDIYRGKSKPLAKVTDYLLYIMMFPQLIAGPIVRFNTIADQITHRVSSSGDQLHGFFRFCLGLAKKVIIANNIGRTIDPLFGQIENLNAGTAWVVILAYAFQIYFDFSGYSDMAIGLGKMMGFKFPENFNSPYTSRSITEFWRRWHITLGEWMRDYLYIPLGGNRVDSTYRLYFNLSFVFLMSGLWHGASWNFVLWGIFHGVFLMLDRWFLKAFLKRLGQALSVLITFIIVLLSWVIFRLEDMAEAKSFYQQLFDFSDWSLNNFSSGFWWLMLIAAFIAFCHLNAKARRLENWLLNTPRKSLGRLIQFAFSILLFIICLAELATTDFNPFIYFRF